MECRASAGRDHLGIQTNFQVANVFDFSKEVEFIALSNDHIRHSALIISRNGYTLAKNLMYLTSSWMTGVKFSRLPQECGIPYLGDRPCQCLDRANSSTVQSVKPSLSLLRELYQPQESQ